MQEATFLILTALAAEAARLQAHAAAALRRLNVAGGMAT